MYIIVKMIHGSHLYGMNIEGSDIDYKGIFMPDIEQIYLGKIPKSINNDTNKTNNKNTSDDIDDEFYSLHYFVELACQGQTIAIDMLHAPKNMLIETSRTWDFIVENRTKFYTKNLKAFVSYARKQAAKYGVKGSRLNDAKSVVDFFESNPIKSIRLKEIWSLLPEGEHIQKLPANENNIRMYNVCGKNLGETCTLDYSLNIVKKFYEDYGHRAKQAAENKGIDWKAISHALRAAYQVRQILTEQTVTFPLPQAEYLKDIKTGKLDFQKVVLPKLEVLMSEIEEIASISDLPEKADRKFWEEFIINECKKIRD